MAAIHRLDVFRRFHDEICNILDADSSTLSSFAGKLYSKELVGMKTKREVLRIQGYQGADILLDHVMMKLKSDTRRYEAVLEIIGEEEALSDVRAKMVASQTTSSDTNMIRKGPPTCTDSINDAESCARRLRNSFEELVIIINTATTTTDVSNLRLRINVFFSSECPGQYTTDGGILSKLDKCSTPEGILLCLIRDNFIGYLNYKLLEVFVKASGSDPSLKASIEEYEQEYLKLFKCNFHSIIRLFRNPILAAVIPAFSLPDFSIRLGTKWEESSVYELKELFQDRFPWAEHLIILDVTKNCVLIKYGVLPFFISAVIRDLTDPTVIEELKREDITIELSPELIKYSITSLPEQIPSYPTLEISSSDVVQFLRTHDVAITDRQKAQLQQQRRLISTVSEDPEGTVISDDRQLLEATLTSEGLKDLPMKNLLSDWDEHGEKNSSSGFHEDLQVLDLTIREDATHAEKNFVYEKALKQLLEERKTMETKNDILKKMKMELEAKLSKAERQIQHAEHSAEEQGTTTSDSEVDTLSDFGEHGVTGTIKPMPALLRALHRKNQHSTSTITEYLTTEPVAADSSQPTVVSMVMELEGLVEWEVFAVHLPDITLNDIERIKKEKQYLSFEKQKEALFSHWLSVYPDASWDDVFEALMNAKEFGLASKILDHNIPSASASEVVPLTVTEMDSQLKDLVDWELFATYLPGITRYHIQTIKQDNSLLSDQKMALYQCWLSQYSKRASWSHVITALRKIGQYSLAQNIESII